MRTRTSATLLTTWLILLSILTVPSLATRVPPTIKPAESLPESTPWDLRALSQAPAFQWLDGKSEVRSLKYTGPEYKGSPTQVFAYYASPATLSPNKQFPQPFPAVVLVHGGGGTAFSEWAKLWADRGYAAIAMDLAGCEADRKRMADGGPGQSDTEKFGAIDGPAGDQWTYHAVSNVLLAHSLILSFDEVDPNRTAVTGISWGGYLTCIVAGLDNRFKAAVPVYGCGFLRDNSCWLPQFSRMGPEKTAKWNDLWDPSRYVGSAAMPVFFVNGTNDFAYPLDSYSKTYGLVKTTGNFRITVNMPHGHSVGWAPKEIGIFIDEQLISGKPLPRLAQPRITDGRIECSFTASTSATSAQLHYTTDSGAINKLVWENVPAEIENGTITAPAPPENVRIWFLTLTDERNATVSSKLVFAK